MTDEQRLRDDLRAAIPDPPNPRPRVGAVRLILLRRRQRRRSIAGVVLAVALVVGVVSAYVYRVQTQPPTSEAPTTDTLTQPPATHSPPPATVAVPRCRPSLLTDDATGRSEDLTALRLCVLRELPHGGSFRVLGGVALRQAQTQAVIDDLRAHERPTLRSNAICDADPNFFLVLVGTTAAGATATVQTGAADCGVWTTTDGRWRPSPSTQRLLDRLVERAEH